MSSSIAKRLSLSLVILLCIQLVFYQPVLAGTENRDKVKELNLVFLHGMGGNPCAFQLLSDQIKDLLPRYITRYQETHPDISVKANTLVRCYPAYVGIVHWAQNVADSINTHFSDKDNLILVGHSMGGKTALYITAHNTGNISDKVAAVVTINSPIRNLNQYYVPSGVPMVDYCRTTLLGSDTGICNSLAYYDSYYDGITVSKNKHWLALVSAESAPLSPKFDRTGVDIWPRNMDDGVVPLSAQFSDGADIIYYGEHGHSDIAMFDDTSRSVADIILRYIFGDPVECSVLARSGSLEHEADWLLGTDRWSDMVGGIVASTGTIEHKNSSFFKWQEFEDSVGEYGEGDIRAHSSLRLLSLPVITSINDARWLISDNTNDFQLYVRSRAAPLTSVKIEWTTYRSGMFAPDEGRAFYDVEISEGTPLTSIRYVSWLNDDPRNPIIWIWSEAQSPFRWFKADWYIYKKEIRQIGIISGISVKSITAEHLVHASGLSLIWLPETMRSGILNNKSNPN